MCTGNFYSSLLNFKNVFTVGSPVYLTSRPSNISWAFFSSLILLLVLHKKFFLICSVPCKALRALLSRLFIDSLLVGQVLRAGLSIWLLLSSIHRVRLKICFSQHWMHVFERLLANINHFSIALSMATGANMLLYYLDKETSDCSVNISIIIKKKIAVISKQPK